MSMSINYLGKFLPEANTCLMFINQLRSVIKKSTWDHGPDEETSGGKALKYYSSVRIMMKTGSIQKIDVKSRITGAKDKEPINVKVKVTIVKNKIDKPHFSAPLFIRFGEGFDNISSIMELAINTNTINKKGSFLTFEVNGKTIFNVQGTEQLHTLLVEQPETLKLLTDKIVFKQDEESKVMEAQEEEEITGDPDLDLMLNQASETFVKKAKAGIPPEEEPVPEPEKKPRKNAKNKD
jgi:recombination protein RecA